MADKGFTALVKIEQDQYQNTIYLHKYFNLGEQTNETVAMFSMWFYL